MLLTLAIEARRYRLSAKDRNGFARQWRIALNSKCVGSTSGAMCATMAEYLENGVEFSGRKDFVEDLAAYVRRSYRTRYRRDEVRAVCEFLDVVADDDDDELLEKFIRKGTKNFPDAACFHHLAGEQEMAKGPYGCDRRRAKRSFERVVESARESGDPRDLELVEDAKRNLTFLRDAGPSQPSHVGPGPASGLGEMMETFFEICDRMGFDPEEILNSASDDMPPMPFRTDAGDQQKKKKKRKQSRAKR